MKNPDLSRLAVLPGQHQHDKMLRAADLHRMFRADQTSGSHGHASRVRAGRVSVLHGARLWCYLRSPEGKAASVVSKHIIQRSPILCLQIVRPDLPTMTHTDSGEVVDPRPNGETIRRKSVSSKAKEVVTIGKSFLRCGLTIALTSDCATDQIRPDWEEKLNTVKAAAARRASRRIIMHRVRSRIQTGVIRPLMTCDRLATGSSRSGTHRPATEQT